LLLVRKANILAETKLQIPESGLKENLTKNTLLFVIEDADIRPEMKLFYGRKGEDDLCFLRAIHIFLIRRGNAMVFLGLDCVFIANRHSQKNQLSTL
jgi:hypothetical protein